MAFYTELPVYKDSYQLVLKVFEETKNFPREYKYTRGQDHGRILENIVFLELLRKKYEVFFHQEEKECDFLIRDQGKIKIAIQVSTHLDDEKLKKRELAGLEEAMRLFDIPEGLILTEIQNLWK